MVAAPYRPSVSALFTHAESAPMPPDELLLRALLCRGQEQALLANQICIVNNSLEMSESSVLQPIEASFQFGSRAVPHCQHCPFFPSLIYVLCTPYTVDPFPLFPVAESRG